MSLIASNHKRNVCDLRGYVVFFTAMKQMHLTVKGYDTSHQHFVHSVQWVTITVKP